MNDLGDVAPSLVEQKLDRIEEMLKKMLRPTLVWEPGSVSNLVPAEQVVRATKASLRQDLVVALGEEMEVDKGPATGPPPMPDTERSWRRGSNAKRQSMLEAINRLLPEEG